ncbi:MAG: DUF1648 domain-containing protein [Bacteroidetes bacterium]|nr:DUF1648 domain-containing protein [Bacteroidota bacterium]
MEAKRPKIKLIPSTTDKLLDLLSWLTLLVLWGYTFSHYSSLPETIPTHFNAAGEADGFGSKASLIALPIIATVLFIGLTVLNRYPHVFNYPTAITQDNALRLYTLATRMLSYLKLVLVLVFGGIELMTIQHASGKGAGLGAWFLPLTLILIFLPLIYFVIKSVKSN